MKKYAEMLKQAQKGLRFWTHTAMRQYVVAVINRMETREMSRADLAKEMEVSPAYVSKMLRGEANFTLETMVKLARAVGGRLQVSIIDATQSQAVTQSATIAVATETDAAHTMTLGGTAGRWRKMPCSNDPYVRVAA